MDQLPLRTPVSAHHRKPVLDVVVPVFNEETDLEPSVRRLHAHLRETFPYPFRITVADNTSTDATPRIAARLAQRAASACRPRGAAFLPGIIAGALSKVSRGRGGW